MLILLIQAKTIHWIMTYDLSFFIPETMTRLLRCQLKEEAEAEEVLCV